MNLKDIELCLRVGVNLHSVSIFILYKLDAFYRVLLYFSLQKPFDFKKTQGRRVWERPVIT